MIDIYFVNTIFNIIWYVFSILFVLYKFTSFFSYIYNFGKFLGQLTQGVFYVKDRVVQFTEHRRNQYITRPSTPSQQSFFSRIKNKFTSYFWGERVKSDIEMPIYTRVSDVSFKPHPNPKRKTKEDVHFEDCMNELMKESMPKGSFVSIDLNPRDKFDSNYESYYDTSCPTSELSKSGLSKSELTKSDNLYLGSGIGSGIESEEYFIKKDITSEPQIINVENESENVRQKFNIQDSNMLFNSNFIKNTFKG
jgi:hypothetical protein